jgi:hypothetical protein
MDSEQWIRVAVTEHEGGALSRNRRYTTFWMASAKLRSHRRVVGKGMSHSVMITWPSSEERLPLLNRVEPTFGEGAEIMVLLSTETRPGAGNADAALLAYEVSPGVWVPNVK